MKEKLISRDKAFIDLTKPEILNKINIDKELEPYFINVLNKFQKFFEENGLMSATNFALLFEEYLLSNNDKKYSIKFDDIEKYADAGYFAGLYVPRDKVIIINKTIFSELAGVDDEAIESILAHEFIHFLSMTTSPWIETKNGEFVQIKDFFQEPFIRGGFVAEGFTQLITEMMYPYNVTYYPFTSMMSMYLNLYDGQNDLHNFFRGRFPGKKFHSNHLQNFVESAEKIYYMNYADKNSWQEQIEHPYYQEAFTYLIEGFKEQVDLEIERYQFATVEEFIDRIYGFKALSISQNSYLEQVSNQLVTSFVSKYFPDSSLNQQFIMKQEIQEIIDEKMQLVYESKLNAIYKATEQEHGYYAQVKMYDKSLMLEIYSPKGTLLRYDAISKSEDFSASYNLTNSMSTVDKRVDFYIEKGNFYLSIYDEKLRSLSDEDLEKLSEDKQPTLYSMPLNSKEDKAKKSEILKETLEKCASLNLEIKPIDFAQMQILKKDNNALAILKVNDFFDNEDEQALLVTTGEKLELKFYYANGKHCKEIKQLLPGLVKVPVSEGKNIFVKGVLKGSDLSLVAFDEQGQNHKELDIQYNYWASKQYFDNIKEKEEFAEVTSLQQ